MKTRSGLLGTAAIAVVLAMSAAVAPAFAQEAGEVDEIYIVAQRRSENLQEVPIAATAVSSERVSELLSGGGDVLSLSGRAPGLNVESSNGRVAPRFYIRGLGNTDFDLAASQPVSVIIDDVVQENVALKSFPIFDVEQVEVLRGPQGTLFGRNTPAGIVHFRSVRPSETPDARVNVSVGSFGTSVMDAAMGGGLAEGVSGRAAFSYRHRSDWIDNTFNGEDLGDYDDLAARVQLLFEPNESFSALVNLHGRTYDGTSTLFRANVLSPGSNDLNGNFERDEVFYNGGGNNRQGYDQLGGALTLTYDFGAVTLTSISGYETLEGHSRGDIDGGVSGIGPGFIPFDADTQDSIDDLTQFTQEVRLASDTDGAFNWQAGVFYFDSDLTISTVGFGFPPLTTVNHANTSWAVFGQVGYDVTDRLSVSAGVRYTDDDKDLDPVLTSFPVAPVSASDEQVSWDVSATYAATENVNLYARIANGFRAPSIQGRDIAFFSPPSIASAETIQSYEAGFKSDLFDRRARLNGAVFYYTIEDQQFSAIGGGGNFTRLVNAEEGQAYGFELEGAFALTERLSVTASYAYNHTEIQDANLRVFPCGAGEFNSTGNCTVRDPVTLVTVGANPAVYSVSIDGNPFPQAPEYTVDVTAMYEHPLASGATLFAATDWTARGPFNIFLYDAIEFETDMQFEGGVRLGYRSANGRWETALFGRNITDEENVIGAIDFNNLTAFVNEPRVWGVSLSARY